MHFLKSIIPMCNTYSLLPDNTFFRIRLYIQYIDSKQKYLTNLPNDHLILELNGNFKIGKYKIHNNGLKLFFWWKGPNSKLFVNDKWRISAKNCRKSWNKCNFTLNCSIAFCRENQLQLVTKLPSSNALFLNLAMFSTMFFTRLASYSNITNYI